MDIQVIKQRVIDELKQVYDPEIPVNIHDLGFIYNVDVGENGEVHILMTLTVPGCPIYNLIIQDIKSRVGAIDGVTNVDVELTFEPRWSVDRITEDGKRRLRELGYKV